MATSGAVKDDCCHRIGGGVASNLALKPYEAKLNPPGISVLIGGTPQEAAATWRAAFPKPGPSAKAATVGTADLEAVRQLGFDVVPMPTPNFLNHGRLVNAAHGAAGFTPDNLDQLAKVFTDTTGL